MSFKDVLSGKRKTPYAIFHKFRVDSSIHLRRHIFVEGYEDIGYYGRNASTINGLVPKFHICFGKKILDQVATLYWKSDIKEAIVLFIRDSDFDAFLGRAPSGKDFFLTCGYAVENYVCSAEALEAYLRSVFCLDDAELDLENVVREYTALARTFHQWLAPLYGAAMHAISGNRNVDLNKLKVEDHFRRLLDGEALLLPSTLQELPSIGLEEDDFNTASLALGEAYANLPALQWMRGKFLLTVLTSYLRKKELEFRGLHQAGSLSRFNRKAAANLNELGLFDRLSGLAVPTSRLSSCLQGNAR